MHRVGIIPFDVKDDAMALLFVTSHTRGRWILPKGLPKEGETPVETAAREGFEEAGVEGVILDKFPITVTITKQTDNGKQTVPVTFYPLFVTEQKDEWPESSSRQRHWALLNDASKVAFREDYLALIKQFETIAPWVKEAAADSVQSTPSIAPRLRI